MGFAPAQDVVTARVLQDIAQHPQEAFAAQALPMFNEHPTCQQVSLVLDVRVESFDTYQSCHSNAAAYRVEWNNVGCTPTAMFMCEYHRDEFLLDAEGDEDITYTYVTAL
jgi:hypothetical protein